MNVKPRTLDKHLNTWCAIEKLKAKNQFRNAAYDINGLFYILYGCFMPQHKRSTYTYNDERMPITKCAYYFVYMYVYPNIVFYYLLQLFEENCYG